MTHPRISISFSCRVLALALASGILFSSSRASESAGTLQLEHLSTLKLGAFDEGAAEMADYDPATKRLFAVNGETRAVSVIDMSDPSRISLIEELDISEHGNSPTCVSTNGAIVAVTIANKDKQAPGKIAFFTTAGEFQGTADAGALPDHVGFSPDGNLCIVANEGEPSDDYQTDPEGSVTIVDVSDGRPGETTQVTFGDLIAGDDVRVYGPGATLAQDLEPEHIAVSADSQTAWIICQENNAVVTVDLDARKATGVKGLGFKNHSQDGNGFDASNKTENVAIQPWPTRGMYQPDATVVHEIDGNSYLFTANEGDARDYVIEHDNGEEETAYSEEERVEDLKLDREKFPNAKELQKETNLGRLKVTNATGDTDGDGDIDEIHSLGARSFSIWDADWNLVYDSGDIFETVTAQDLGEGFNSTNDEHPSYKDRSDDKGPEPEAIAVGEIGEKAYAFIGLERVGGVMIFDVTEPAQSTFVSYSNRRDFSAAIESEDAGDLGPEDVEFIPAGDSPNGKPLLVVTSEVSGTVSVFEVK